MCNRYVYKAKGPELATYFDVSTPTVHAEIFNEANYNVAPRNLVPVLIGSAFKALTWGFKVPKGIVLNARSETITEIRLFAQSIKERRCIIPASGFYEWQRVAGQRPQPYYFSPTEPNGLFAFAGIWRGDECCIVTTNANGVVGAIHDRMPVILWPGKYRTWLAAATPLESVLSMLHLSPDAWIRGWPVDKAVNKVSAKGPQLMERAKGLVEQADFLDDIGD